METWEFRTWKHGFLHFLYGHHNGRQKSNIRFIGYGPLDFLETWIKVGLYGHHLKQISLEGTTKIPTEFL